MILPMKTGDLKLKALHAIGEALGHKLSEDSYTTLYRRLTLPELERLRDDLDSEPTSTRKPTLTVMRYEPITGGGVLGATGGSGGAVGGLSGGSGKPFGS